MDDAMTEQLNSEMRASVTRSLQSRRPILHHLNADTSWLLQLPRPRTSTNVSGRIYYNILIDPWLSGPQSDVASWFSQQWHANEPKVGSIAAVAALAREVEALAREELESEHVNGVADGLSNGVANGYTSNSDRVRNDLTERYIDCVAISHEFTDHCHKETLEHVDPDTPVFAGGEKATNLIKSWKHFRTVLNAPAFCPAQTPDWRSTALPPLPEWLSISRLVNASEALYYHSALLITFAPTAIDTPTSIATPPAEAIIYTPHGVSASIVPDLSALEPPIQTLALLHGLHDITIDWGQQLNLGGHNGLQAQRKLKAKYWIGTHDEVKKGGGLVSWFLRRKVISVEEAVHQERTTLKDEAADKMWDDVEFAEIANGESLVLK